MSEETPPFDAMEPPTAVIKPGRRISTVWIIPVIALIIGGWLVYRTLSQKGPEITITFDTAVGLEAGKTPLKYKEVVVGTIASVTLDPQSRTVKAVAEMTKAAEPFLTETTRFWVVRPRLGIREISGLGTLISGAYVELDPGTGTEPKRTFTALDEPPLIRADTPGKEIVLVTDTLGSVSRGSPVYFRGIEAGEVLGYELASDKSKVLIHAFIRSPNDRLIKRTTRFWNVGGVQVSMGVNGVKVNAGTLQSLLLGGVAFETPDLLGNGEPVPDKTRFVLFNSRQEIQETAYTEKAKFVLYFNSSVRGLNVGAPVEFRGIKMGSVLDIRLEMDPEKTETFIPVLIELDLDRVSILGSDTVGPQISEEERRIKLEKMIRRGLRARLKTGNFLTGQLVVDLDMYPDTPVHLANRNRDYLEIPTLPAQMEEISNSITDVLAKLQRLPLDKISKELVSTLEGADRLVNSDEIKGTLASLKNASEQLETLLAGVDKRLVPEAAGTLKKAETTMAAAEKVLRSLDSIVSEDSAMRYQTQEAIQEIAATARSIRQFTEFLQRNPNALLTGKSPQ